AQVVTVATCEKREIFGGLTEAGGGDNPIVGLHPQAAGTAGNPGDEAVEVPEGLLRQGLSRPDDRMGFGQVAHGETGCAGSNLVEGPQHQVDDVVRAVDAGGEEQQGSL